MIINYDQNPALSVDQKLQSLIENIHLALNELQAEQKAVEAQVNMLNDDTESIKNSISERAYRQESNTYGLLEVKKSLRIVSLSFRGDSNALTKGVYTKLFTLPEGERPTTTIFFTAYNNHTGAVSKAPMVGYLSPSGECWIWAYADGENMSAPRFNLSYIV